MVGRGRLGRSLAHALEAAGADVELAKGRAAPRSLEREGVLVFAVPDPAIASVASRWAPAVRREHVALHVSGARPREELSAIAARGAATGVLHPLVSFASSRPPPLAGATAFASGDRRALTAARALGRLVGLEVIASPEPITGPRYHAAAALVANGAIALVGRGVSELEALGVSRRDASRALGALLSTVAWNVRTLGVDEALTGPIVRGDRGAVASHLAALDGAGSEATAALYRAVMPLLVAVAETRGTEAGALAAITSLLRAPRRRPR